MKCDCSGGPVKTMHGYQCCMFDAFKTVVYFDRGEPKKTTRKSGKVRLDEKNGDPQKCRQCLKAEGYIK